MSMLSPPGATLVRLMGEMPRGPRREGLFAPRTWCWFHLSRSGP
jgi:hypothetical protein